MQKIFLLFIISIILIACKEKEEVVNMDDVVKKIDDPTHTTKDTLKNKTVFKPSLSSEMLESVQLKWDSVLINEELSVPERFKPTKTEKFTYWNEGKSIDYYRWTFTDSTKSMKAFLNWMNCYGERCLMIDLRTAANIQRNAVLILQNDTSIVQIQSPHVGNNELKKWKSLYLNPEKIKWNYIVFQPKGGKAIWSKFENKEEMEFVQLETK